LIRNDNKENVLIERRKTHDDTKGHQKDKRLTIVMISSFLYSKGIELK